MSKQPRRKQKVEFRSVKSLPGGAKTNRQAYFVMNVVAGRAAWPFLTAKPPHLLFPGGRALSLGTAGSVTRWENSSVGSPNTSSLLSLTGSYTGLWPCQSVFPGFSPYPRENEIGGALKFGPSQLVFRVPRGCMHTLPAASSQTRVTQYQLFKFVYHVIMWHRLADKTHRSNT